MLQKIKKIFIYTFFIYTLFGFFVLPYLIKSQIISNVAKETNAKITIKSVFFNPFTINLKISGIKLFAPDDKKLLSLDALNLDLELYSLLNSAVHVKSFILKKPEISLVLYKDKSINFNSIMKSSEDKAQTKDDNDTQIHMPRIILDTVAIIDGKLHYEDFTHKTKFDFSVDTIGFKLKNVDTNDFDNSNGKIRFYSLLGDGGFVDLKANVRGFKPLIVDGSFDFEASKLYTQWRYLQDSLNLEVANGKISLHADYFLNIEDLNATKIENLSVDLEKLRIKPKTKFKDILNLHSFYAHGTTIFPFMQDIKIHTVGLDSLDIKAFRDENGTIDWIEYLKSDDSKPQTVRKNILPWHVEIDEIVLENIKVDFNDKGMEPNLHTNIDALNVYAENFTFQTTKEIKIDLEHFAIKSSKIRVEDNLTEPHVVNTFDQIALNAYNVSLDKKSWLKYDFFTRVNQGGNIQAKGKLRQNPLTQEGEFEIQKLSLKEFSPYIEQKAYLTLDDGYFNLKADMKYLPSKNTPDLNVNGSMSLENISVNESRNNSLLLSFSKLGLKSFIFEAMPNRMFINEVNLDSLYVNALIDKHKILNFATLLKEKVKKEDPKVLDKEEKKSNFPIKIAKLKVTNASAKFADLSLPIQFRTNIHDLSGVVYSISNIPGETTQVDISGQVDKYGATKLQGSLSSSNPKAFTDLSFNFRNLELSSLSGYSASFAGYKIDKGKLFLDLGYNILDSNLVGKNSIVIKKIQLGDTLKDENLTKLPLGFVIALLEDKNGVIDIDMPVEGNVDEPDFRYGALVWKTLGNLIRKAVTSPFAFLGSVMGIDADDLESIDFEAGFATILPPEKEKLDSIAKMMSERPKIYLAISPQYDGVSDKASIAKVKLIALVAKKSGAENEEEGQSLISEKLLESIYQDFKADDKLKKIKEDLSAKYENEALDAAYMQALIKECMALQSVSKIELISLANQRVDNLVKYMSEENGIDLKRVIVKEVSAVNTENEKWVKTKMEIEVK